MGYTHYWKEAENKKISKRDLENAIKMMGRIINDNRDIVACWYGEDEPIVTEKDVNFNGKGNLKCENFVMSVYWDGSLNYCKTCRNPYDIVVVACLAVLKHYCGDAIKITSDGNTEEELNPGIELARQYIPEIEKDFRKIFEN